MNFPLYIAKRYLLSKKSHNIINIISAISVVGVSVGTMALIIVLSVFNGFENLVISLYNSFDSDIKITVKEGKSFDPASLAVDSIKNLEGVKYYTEVIEENALIKYKDKQFIATIKATNDAYLKHCGLDSMLMAGDLVLEKEGQPFTLMGQGVAYNLGINLNDFFNPVTLYVPKRGTEISTTNPEQAFSTRAIYPSGIFSIQQEIDSKYVLLPLSFARELLQYEKEVTSLEIGLSHEADDDKIQKKIEGILGGKFLVQNRYQQHETLYKIMKSEKWAIFLILAFILVIATFNIIGSLTMLIIDKKKDIGILMNMGADIDMIRKIFLIEGILIASVGAFSGITLGAIICWLQQTFGLVKLQGAGSFVIEAYPVQMQLSDFIYVLITVLVIGFIAAWFPAKQLVKKADLFRAKEL